jgi:predicted O-methyltransferase YrrM
LPQSKLENCKVYNSRQLLIQSLSLGPRGIEVGTQKGDFAKHILDSVSSLRELTLIDMDLSQLETKNIADSRVRLMEGKSQDCLNTLQDDHYDFIYIDAGHGYDDFKHDLEISARKINSNGVIICNDYTSWSPLEVEPYGVLRALNEFLVSHENNFDVIALGLHVWGYHDLAIRKKS